MWQQSRARSSTASWKPRATQPEKAKVELRVQHALRSAQQQSLRLTTTATI